MAAGRWLRMCPDDGECVWLMSRNVWRVWVCVGWLGEGGEGPVLNVYVILIDLYDLFIYFLNCGLLSNMSILRVW